MTMQYLLSIDLSDIFMYVSAPLDYYYYFRSAHQLNSDEYFILYRMELCNFSPGKPKDLQARTI